MTMNGAAAGAYRDVAHSHFPPDDRSSLYSPRAASVSGSFLNSEIFSTAVLVLFVSVPYHTNGSTAKKWYHAFGCRIIPILNESF